MSRVTQSDRQSRPTNQSQPARWSSSKHPEVRTAVAQASAGQYVMKCYNCKKASHRISECRQPKRAAGSCYSCGSMNHVVKNCPKNVGRVSSEPTPQVMHYIEETGREPYWLNVSFSIKNSKDFEGKAVFDSGSPISVVKQCLLPEYEIQPDYDAPPYVGAGGADLNIIDIYFIDVSCDPNPELTVDKDCTYEDRTRLTNFYNTHYVKKFRESQMKKAEINISLKSDIPIAYGPRSLAFGDRRKLQEMLDDMEEKSIIRPSESEYSSPIVLVRKKNGEMRLCIDYRDVNAVTVQDNFPQPSSEDNLSKLHEKKYFSRLDLKNGYYHVDVAPASIKYTAFTCPLERCSIPI